MHKTFVCGCGRNMRFFCVFEADCPIVAILDAIFGHLIFSVIIGIYGQVCLVYEIQSGTWAGAISWPAIPAS
jgi:hypothetical protein